MAQRRANNKNARQRSSKPQRAGQGTEKTRQGNERPGQKFQRQGQKPRTKASTVGWIEGRRACAEALETGVPLRQALVASGDETLASLVARLKTAGVEVQGVPRDRLDAMSSHGAHQGILCQTAPYRYADLEDVIARAGEGDALVVVLDHVTDEGNFGAIVRSAEVVGAAGVVIAPIAQVPNLATALDRLKEAGFWAAAATEHADQDVWQAPLDGRIALVMGSEGSGVSRLVREHCDFECRLPQRGRVESLNVAQATTVLCYEWLRRSMAKGDGR